jgi:hypothetical protein
MHYLLRFYHAVNKYAQVRVCVHALLTLSGSITQRTCMPQREYNPCIINRLYYVESIYAQVRV